MQLLNILPILGIILSMCSAFMGNHIAKGFGAEGSNFYIPSRCQSISDTEPPIQNGYIFYSEISPPNELDSQQPIYRYNLFTLGDQQLPVNKGVRAINSKNGRWIALFTAPSQISRLSPYDTYGQIKIYDLVNNEIYVVDWQPTWIQAYGWVNDKLAIGRGENPVEILLVNPEDGSTELLTALFISSFSDRHWVSIDPTGEYVAYLPSDGLGPEGPITIAHLGRDGVEWEDALIEQGVFKNIDEVKIFEASWSPNGNDFAFSRFGTSNLFIWNSTNRQVTSIPVSTSEHVRLITHSRWSPDGTKLAYWVISNTDTESSASLHITNLTLNETRTYCIESDNPLGLGTLWSPDGNYLAITSGGEPSIPEILDISTGERWQIAPNPIALYSWLTAN